MARVLLTKRGKKIPKSPFNLLQEIYIRDPWKVMVCCIFLNQTTRKQVDKVRDQFFKKWSTPKKLLKARPEEIAEMTRSLGFYNRRAKTLLKFSEEWLKEWKSVRELHGIGQYATDSWNMFVEGEIVENPSDHVLKNYVKWRAQHVLSENTKESTSIMTPKENLGVLPVLGVQ